MVVCFVANTERGQGVYVGGGAGKGEEKGKRRVGICAELRCVHAEGGKQTLVRKCNWNAEAYSRGGERRLHGVQKVQAEVSSVEDQKPSSHGTQLVPTSPAPPHPCPGGHDAEHSAITPAFPAP